MSPSDTPDEVAYLKRADGSAIAYCKTDGTGPGVIFLHGLNSDMDGGKALELEALCRDRGRAFVRFDMFGHGKSDGDFPDGSISRWAEDAITVLDELTEGPQVLVGSSMGGWVMLRTALARPERIAGLMGIAAAPDFTEDLMWANFSEEARTEVMTKGSIALPSDYDEPYIISKGLIEDGRTNLLLRDEIPLSMPMRLVHGMADEDVPFETSNRIAQRVESKAVHVILVKDGDHRLSRPEDLKLLARTLNGLCEAVKS